MRAFLNMSPAQFSKIATKEPRRAIYNWKFPLQCLRPSPISVIIFVTVAGAVGDGGNGCPARCSCGTDDGFVNSLAVKCSSLGLLDLPVMLNSSTLHTLDLSENELSLLKNSSFSSYSSLSTLILSYNKVEEIEINAFVGLQMIREIDLSYNNLQSFNPEIFSSNTILDAVSLRGNNLAYLSSDFPILISASISFLDLSSCSLTTIHPVTFSSLFSLYELDLSFNNLQTLSLRTLENIPDLSILELKNNPWICNCDIVEVLQWAESRREQQPAHQPVKCLEGQKYRTLWTVAGGNRSCSESKTAEPVVTREREFSTDMAVDLRIISVGVAPTLGSSPGTTLQGVTENAVTSEDELGATTESETGGCASLLCWNVNTLMVFVILPITLGVAVVVSLIAVHYVKKRCNVHRTQHNIQTKYNKAGELLLNTQLTEDITKKHAGYENRGSDDVGGTECQVCGQID